MQDLATDDDDVKILPPDRSLHKKLGNIDLDLLLPKKLIEEGQKIIDQSTDTFFDECTSEIVTLENVALSMRASGVKELGDLVKLAFSIKAKAGLGGYDLVATIARSLQLFCEKMSKNEISEIDRNLIEWHVESIKRLLANKVKGSGGEIGQQILSELKKMGTISL